MPTIETGTAMAILVVVDVPPEKAVGSLVELVVCAAADSVDVDVDLDAEVVDEDEIYDDFDPWEDADDVADGTDDAVGEYEVIASNGLVGIGVLYTVALISMAGVSLCAEYAVNSLTEGHGSVGNSSVTVGSAFTVSGV